MYDTSIYNWLYIRILIEYSELIVNLFFFRNSIGTLVYNGLTSSNRINGSFIYFMNPSGT